MRYVDRTQRPSGRIDLRDCNYDSAPDTAFAVQGLAPVVELGRPLRGTCPEWDAYLASVERFVRTAAEGMLDGGFHTPNHRWVISAALAQAASLFPELPVQPVIEAYLAEGIDVDADGAYTERSAGVYDAICDRSMLLLWEHRACRPALEAAVANLTLNLHMLHADGTIETGVSTRQDYGKRPVPSAMALPYLMASRAAPDDRFVAAADLIWTQGRGDAPGLTGHMLKHGEMSQSSSHAALFNLRRTFGHIGLWRSRRGAMSATAFRNATRLFTLVFGRAELTAVKISQSYFGAGRFVGDEMGETEDGCRLVSRGESVAHRPGYELPLGRPVDAGRWFETRSERQWRPLPPCVSELRVAEADDGFDLTYRTLDGMPGVLAQIALDFPPGGIWETRDGCFRPQAGQVIFLKRGRGAMRYGQDTIEIGPGSYAHRMWAMRDAESAPEHVRVLLTFVTPVAHTLHIRCAHGVAAVTGGGAV